MRDVSNPKFHADHIARVACGSVTWMAERTGGICEAEEMPTKRKEDVQGEASGVSMNHRRIVT